MSVKGRLLPYQQRYVADNSKSIIVEKARRTGYTFATAAAAVRRCLVIKEDHHFSSGDQEVSKKFISDCITWAKIYNLSLPKGSQIDVAKATTEKLIMPNGCMIVAVSSSPKALRGAGGSVTLDEFAHHEDPIELYKAACACNLRGGQIRIISTHNGPATFFQQLCKEALAKKNDFSHHKVTLVDAVNDGLALSIPGKHLDLLPDVAAVNAAFIESVKRSAINEDIFQEEYMCVPAALKALITDEQYEKLILPGFEILTDLDHSVGYGDLFIGVDLGRTQDLTVVWVLQRGHDSKAPEHLQDVYRTLCVMALKNVEFSVQYPMISQIVSHPDVVRVVIDQGAGGRQLSDDLVSEYGNIILPYGINAPRKALLSENVKKYVIQSRVSLPGEFAIKEDLLAMRRLATAKGNVSYDGSTSTTHCDYFMALALAIEAAHMPATFKNAA